MLNFKFFAYLLVLSSSLTGVDQALSNTSDGIVFYKSDLFYDVGHSIAEDSEQAYTRPENQRQAKNDFQKRSEEICKEKAKKTAGPKGHTYQVRLKLDYFDKKSIHYDYECLWIPKKEKPKKVAKPTLQIDLENMIYAFRVENEKEMRDLETNFSLSVVPYPKPHFSECVAIDSKSNRPILNKGKFVIGDIKECLSPSEMAGDIDMDGVCSNRFFQYMTFDEVKSKIELNIVYRKKLSEKNCEALGVSLGHSNASDKTVNQKYDLPQIGNTEEISSGQATRQ